MAEVIKERKNKVKWNGEKTSEEKCRGIRNRIL